MDPITIAAGLLGLWGLSRLLSNTSNLPIVIPPDQPWPTVTPPGADCPPNLPVPLGLVAIRPPWPSPQFGAAISPWGYKQLKHPLGTRIIDVVAGELVVARIEYHFHPVGMKGVTAWGCHRGASVYRPTGQWVQIG